VVASEVKALATQTARATDQIGAQIVAIRESTAEAVEAVRDVGSAISQVAEVATAIAAAVEQQAAATKEISSSVQGVTRATTESAQAMEQVLGIAQRTDLVSQSVLTAAGEVGETAGTLRVEVNDFLSAMKRSDVYERRAYERLPGRGATAWVTIRGSEEMTAVIRDISRGGIALLTSADAASGTDVQVRLAGGATVAGRVVRFAAGVLSVAFRQDSATIGVVDRALESFERGERGLAA
jgi:methyl-accepting chemotaxis protein